MCTSILTDIFIKLRQRRNIIVAALNRKWPVVRLLWYWVSRELPQVFLKWQPYTSGFKHCSFARQSSNKQRIRDAHKRIMLLNHPDRGKWSVRCCCSHLEVKCIFCSFLSINFRRFSIPRCENQRSQGLLRNRKVNIRNPFILYFVISSYPCPFLHAPVPCRLDCWFYLMNELFRISPFCVFSCRVMSDWRTGVTKRENLTQSTKQGSRVSFFSLSWFCRFWLMCAVRQWILLCWNR